MPIEYEMKYLYDTTVKAISDYSEEAFSASWLYGIENTIVSGILEKNQDIINCFTNYEIAAMEELVRRGLWVKWSDQLGKPVLSPDPLNNYIIWNDSTPIPCGAD